MNFNFKANNALALMHFRYVIAVLYATQENQHWTFDSILSGFTVA